MDNPWTPTDYSWTSMDNPWISVDNPWASMDYLWISMYSQWINLVNNPWIVHGFTTGKHFKLIKASIVTQIMRSCICHAPE